MNRNDRRRINRSMETVRRNMREILAHKGEWVLIKGSRIIGFFETFEKGLRMGYNRFRAFTLHEIDALFKTERGRFLLRPSA